MADHFRTALTRRAAIGGLCAMVGAGALGWRAYASLGRPLSPKAAGRDPIQQGVHYLLSTELRGLSCLNRTTGAPTRLDRTGIIFVIHFVAGAIADQLTQSTRNKLRARIRRLQMHSAWGYAVNAPLDSDDTAFALRALAVLGEPEDSETFREGLHALQSFREPSSAWYRTFQSTRKGIRLVGPGGEEANLEAHPEVNANVLALLSDYAMASSQTISALQRACSDLPGSQGFYYPAHFYTLYWLLPLVAKSAPDDPWLDRIVSQAIDLQERAGSWSDDVADTALAMRVIAEGRRRPALQAKVRLSLARAREWLFEEQSADGSWNSEKPIWRFPAPGGDHWEAFDTDRLVGTSLVVGVLRDRGINDA